MVLPDWACRTNSTSNPKSASNSGIFLLPQFLILRLKRPDLRRLVAFRRHTDVKPVALGVVVSGSNANSRRHVGDQLVVVRVLLLDHADDSFAADDVDTFPGSVKENIVAFTRGPQSCNFLPRLCVQNHQHW